MSKGEKMKEIKTVGIVGFGVMGSAIGLNAASSGYRVIFKELNDELVRVMYDKWVIKSLSKRVKKGKITQDDMDKIKSMITGTSKYEDMADCDLVIEAALEDMDLKIKLFADLSSVCRKDAIIVSNTSTFLIEKLMEKVDNQERTAGLHYFFPANINRLVEVIRQKNTSDETYDALINFAKKNRKTAITVKDFPGFAINPIFIASYMVLDSFYGQKYNVATLEDISKKALNVKFGIMWVQNGSGVGTCFHAGASMVEYLSNTVIGYPKMPDALKERLNAGPWNLEDGPILVNEEACNKVKDRLLGTIFVVASHLIEQDVVSTSDLELGIRTALAWPKGPFSMMNEIGMEEAARLVKSSVDAGDFKLPRKFASQDMSPWPL
jgi:3-hydroxyacyl-CoA dehydrogenase